MSPALKMKLKNIWEEAFCKGIQEVKHSPQTFSGRKTICECCIYSKRLTNTLHARNKQYCLCMISKICLIIHLHLRYIGCIEINNTYPCQDHLNLN